MNTYPRKVMRTNDITIEFEKLDLAIVQSVETSALNITFRGRRYFPSLHFIKLLDTSKSAEQFKKKFKSHTRELDDPSNKLNLDKLGLKSSVVDQYEHQVTTRLTNFIAGYRNIESLERVNVLR